MNREKQARAPGTLADLLCLDDHTTSDYALLDCFGDRYLCAHNAVFMRIRRLFLSQGFLYTSSPGALWSDYSVFPLLTLQDIIHNECVPYQATLPTIRRIANQNPSFEIDSDLLSTLLVHNHVLHESAHCVSFRILTERFPGAQLRTHKCTYVTACLLCEAYANAIESLAAALALSEHHRFFYSVNSYIKPLSRRSLFLCECVRVFGFAKVFAIGILVFLRLNARKTHDDSETRRFIFQAVGFQNGITRAERALLNSLITTGFGLSTRFVTDTTPTFFRHQNCTEEYEAVCASLFDPRASTALNLLQGLRELVEYTCRSTVHAGLMIGGPDEQSLASD